MNTDTRPTHALLRGGPFDGVEVPLKGLFVEVPAAPGSKFENHVYSWQQDEDGTYYGKWEAETNN